MVAERRLATRVSFDDPAPFWPGMIVLPLDLQGRLVDFHATPFTSQDALDEEFDFDEFFTPEVLLGMRESFGALVNCGLFALTDSMFLLMFLFAIRLPIRVKGIATVLFVLFFSVLFALLSPEYAAIHVLFWTTAAVLMTRFGIVALVCFQFVRHTVEEFPLPADLTKWYAGYALIPLSLIAILGLYAYYIACAQRRSTVLLS